MTSGIAELYPLDIHVTYELASQDTAKVIDKWNDKCKLIATHATICSYSKYCSPHLLAATSNYV